MKRYFLIGLFFVGLFSDNLLVAAEKPSHSPVEWHSYAQLRFATNFNDYNNFSVRRLKFWMKSSPDFSKHWSFKVQAIFMSIQKEKLFLQDVYAQYNWKSSSIRFGQFIPQYSLQRFQPDYLIPSMERSLGVSFLIPDGGTLGARDIGVQYNLNAIDNHLQFNVGLFNGYGIKEYRFNNNSIMVSQNLSYKIDLNTSDIKLGFSTMYRQADDIFLRGIIPDTISYSGSDFRFSFYGIFTSKYIDFQAEFLQAYLKNYNATGYYGLATVKFNSKNHAYLQYDCYSNDYISPLNNPWYIAGYNYFFKGYKIMLTLQTGFQQSDSGWANRTSIEFQMFFK